MPDLENLPSLGNPAAHDEAAFLSPSIELGVHVGGQGRHVT
jgi:hypothetical protein